jgi:putative radical SAM enzyme (TIGR03279 family)
MARLYEAGIQMNGQIVLCKGINDGVNLERSIRDLMGYLPYLESVSVVPAGLTKFREGLYPLEKFTAGDAEKVLDWIDDFGERIFAEHGIRFVYASDEWYLLAGRELPSASYYDGYPQLANGVGMMRLFMDEFAEALGDPFLRPLHAGNVAVATGLLAYPYMKSMAKRLCERFPELTVQVYGITNDFFGEDITVSGLLAGADLIRQLKGKDLGQRLLLPENVLKFGEDVFLDGITVKELEKALQVRADIVKSSGREFVKAVFL